MIAILVVGRGRITLFLVGVRRSFGGLGVGLAVSDAFMTVLLGCSRSPRLLVSVIRHSVS
jgi:hypothetical protein